MSKTFKMDVSGYDQAEWGAKIESAAKRKDRKEVERLMIAQQDAFLAAFPI